MRNCKKDPAIASTIVQRRTGCSIVGEMKTAARLLKEALKAGYSQAEISRAIKVHHSQVSRWISGKPPRHADAILRLRELVK